jgi:hypothetical protein
VEEASAGLVWRDWILASCLSAVVGVGTATAGAVVLFRLFGHHWFRYVASFIVFTVIHAGVTGLLQHRVLVEALPFLHRREWLMSTLLGSVLTWAAVFMSPLADDLLADGASEWWLTPELSIVLGASLGLAVGAAQMLPLREWVVGPWKWLAGNTISWWIATPALWFIADQYGSDTLLRSLPIALLALLGAGLVVGLVEGWVVRNLGKHDEAAEKYTRNALDDIGSIDLTE